ncbi:MAG: SpoIVB peptidase [Clostridiales bacterium]|nr:SpoIVB peptidase [Clostridiales bacterium]
MLSFKKFTKILLGVIFIAAVVCCLSVSRVFAATSEDEFYIGGFPAGFVLNTQNVEVIGMCEINTESGMVCPAREGGIKSGDIIKKLNDIEITSANKLTEALAEDLSKYNLKILRGGETLDISLQPAFDKSSGKKKLGLLVKDSINGIGTVTYIDKTNNKFGSLGHPVNDENGKIIDINGGCLYGCSIYDVKKGLRGNPGELKGFFDNSHMFGAIKENTKCGIFGDVSKDFNVSNLKRVKKGSVAEATVGKAYIYSTLSGESCDKYEISIVKVDAENKDNRNFVIKINDKRILERAGGIVQGMSGSPIVQNGKLIGAVTHVFVNDPTRGYGISIDNMTSSY